jgi:hypothetical protein
MNSPPDYTYYGKSRTIIIKFSNVRFTNDTFSIVCKDQVSKEILIEKLKSLNPTNFDINREYFFIKNNRDISQCIWKKHQTRIEVYNEWNNNNGNGSGNIINYVDNVFPLDVNASILIENNHILYVLDETLLKFLKSKL